jgi:hypothetical protein
MRCYRQTTFLGSPSCGSLAVKRPLLIDFERGVGERTTRIDSVAGTDEGTGSWSQRWLNKLASIRTIQTR